MHSSKKALIILILGIGVFGYSQYANASQIDVIITDSQLLEESGNQMTYNVQLEFANPSLLILNAGQTEFLVYSQDKKIGNGILEPFVLSPLSSTTVDGKFTTEGFELDAQNSSIEMKIDGVTKYDIWFVSIDVPFEYYPTDEQAREFIHSN